METVKLSTHNGTHLDAPWHYHPTMNEGERSWTIDEVPLEWCFQPGVKLDFRHFADGYVATAADVEAELKRIGHELKPLDIVVVNTSAGGQIRPARLCALRLRHGRGGDAVSAGARRAPHRHRRLELGRALRPHRQALRETHDAKLIWEGHKAGRHIGYCHIEKLHNLESLPAARLHHRLLPGEDRARLGRLDAGGGDRGGMSLFGPSW